MKTVTKTTLNCNITYILYEQHQTKYQKRVKIKFLSLLTILNYIAINFKRKNHTSKSNSLTICLRHQKSCVENLPESGWLCANQDEKDDRWHTIL